MIQELQDAEDEQIVVPVVEMKVLEQEVEKWKDHEELIVVAKKDVSELRNYLIFGGSVVAVSMIVYGVSKMIHYLGGK